MGAVFFFFGGGEGGGRGCDWMCVTRGVCTCRKYEKHIYM
jgi:hypothetical protein